MDLCGQILVSKDKSFFRMRCISCEKDVDQWEDFLEHFSSIHNSKDSEPWADPLATKFCKDEFSIDDIKEEFISEAESKPVYADTKAQEETTNYDDVKKYAMSLRQRSKRKIDSESEDSDDHIPLSKFENESESEDSDDHIPPSKFDPSFSKRSASTTIFIELYKSLPQLWNPKDPNYNDPRLRKNAEKQIIDSMKERCHITLSRQRLKSAIQNVRKQYQSTAELQKAADSKISAITLEYFEMCSFLGNVGDGFDDNTLEDNTAKSLSFAKMNPVSLAFIETLASCPALYDPCHSDYTKINCRRQNHELMSNILKTKHNVIFSADDVQRSIIHLRHWYYKLKERAEQDTDPNGQPLSDAQQLYIEKCSFLPPRVKSECSVCNQTCRTEFNLRVHLFRSHKIGEPPYKCTQCDRSFKLNASLQSHELRSHVGKVHPCKYCERRFAILVDLERHMLTHTGEKPFVCELCGKGFRSRTQLGYHMDAIHTKTRAYKCTMCPKDFLKKRDLDDHIKAHLNIRDKICQVCGKGFTNCHSLIRHRQIHSEVKKFACKMCDARFHQFVGLNSHMKRTHKIVKIPVKPNTS